jgi:RNA recognition motif-containing protein
MCFGCRQPSIWVGGFFLIARGLFLKECQMEAKIYVGNLSYQTTEQSLRELFMQAGSVTSVALIKEPGTQRSKGFAFVEMGSASEVQKAISMFNGYTLDERQLTVNVARPREERNGGGGFRQQNRGRNTNSNRRRY